MLLEHGPVINVQDDGDHTPLHFAAQYGRTEVMRLLLERGADAHVRDKRGYTASDLGSQKGHHEVVELLASPVKK
jgi:ankyrin repeat protein